MLCCFPSVLWHCWLGDRKGIQPVNKLDGCWRCQAVAGHTWLHTIGMDVKWSTVHSRGLRTKTKTASLWSQGGLETNNMVSRDQEHGLKRPRSWSAHQDYGLETMVTVLRPRSWYQDQDHNLKTEITVSRPWSWSQDKDHGLQTTSL